MNRYELAMRNQALAEKRRRGVGPRGLWVGKGGGGAQAQPRLKTDPLRLLVLCPGGPVYTLFATPALYALRAAYPQAHIAVLIGPASEIVLRRNQEVDEMRTMPLLDMPSEQTGPRQLGDWPRVLRAEGYDVALVVAPTDWPAALLAALAGIPRRLGVGGAGTDHLLTDPIPRDAEAHAVTHNLRLVETLVGAPLAVDTKLRFWLDEAVVSLAFRTTLGELAADTRPLVAICPGDGTGPSDWRSEGWAFVADQLILQHDANVILVGGEGGAARRRAIAASMRFEPTLPNLFDPVFQVALFSRCALVMGGHSDLLHLAVALDRPTVMLYGPHDPAYVGPWGDPARHRVLRALMPCAPCGFPDWPDDLPENHPCVRDLDAYAVLDAALEVPAAV